nr:hypothetical protein ISGA_3079 [Gordonia sp. NB41Y]
MTKPKPPRSYTRSIVALITLLSALVLAFGSAVGAGESKAAVLPGFPDASGSIGDVIAALANNGLTQGLAEQWRFELCSSTSDGGPANGGADCTGSTGAGVAVVLPSTIDLVPDGVYKVSQSLFNAVPDWLVGSDGKVLGVTVPVPDAAVADGSAKVIGDGFQFALASGGGNATAIAYLPISVATAGASDGRTAFAFALVGTANAWTTSKIPVEIFTLPLAGDAGLPAIQHVSCYGGLAVGYAEKVGACANVLGTFDFKFDQLQSIPQVQFALTDPTAILADPADTLAGALDGLFNGRGLSLSKDVVRLSLGGSSIIALTSDYGISEPVTIDWLGSRITLFPTANINGADRPNRLALPTIDLGDFDSTQILPVTSIPEIEFPFGLPTVGPFTSSTPALTGAATTSATTRSVAARSVSSSTATSTTTRSQLAAIPTTTGSDDADDTPATSTTTTRTTTTSPSTSEPTTSEPSGTDTDPSDTDSADPDSGENADTDSGTESDGTDTDGTGSTSADTRGETPVADAA